MGDVISAQTNIPTPKYEQWKVVLNERFVGSGEENVRLLVHKSAGVRSA